jgi:sugar phosphate isomerase/epimerase
MKAILHSVSYAGLWGQARLSLEEFIPRAAKLGYSGVMLMTKRPHLSPLDYDQKRLEKLRELLAAHRLNVPCLAGYNDPGAGAGGASFAPLAEVQLIAIRQWVQMAKVLGAPILRLFTGPANNCEDYTVQWRRSVESLRQACDLAGEQGVMIGVQNHDDIAAHYLSLSGPTARPASTPGPWPCTAMTSLRRCVIWAPESCIPPWPTT